MQPHASSLSAQPLSWPLVSLAESHCLHVHGRGYVAVSHQLLLYTNWSTRLVQELTIRVSEGVPAESRDADLFTFELESQILAERG